VAKIVGIRPGVTPASAELTQSATAAIEALDKAALKAEATQDPIAGYLSTQSLFLTAMRELHDDSARQAAEARQPLDPATTRMLVERLAKTNAASAERQMENMSAAAIRLAVSRLAGLGVGIALLGIGMGVAGTWFARDWVSPAGISSCGPVQQVQGEVLHACYVAHPPTGSFR
jgi:hypothetical protein